MRRQQRRPTRGRRRQGTGLRRDGLLDNLQMVVPRVKLPCLKQESVDLPHTDCGIRIDDRRHINPIGPGLGNKSVRLNVIEELLALLSQRLDLLGRIRRNQGLIGRI